MAKLINPFDDDADDSEGYPDGAYYDEPGMVACPYCRKEVSELAEVCPHCESYISREDEQQPKPRWSVAVAILLILLFSVGGVLTFRR